MKRYGVFAVAVLTLLGMLAPPVFAAEAPKVTINGFFDLVTQWSDNLQDQNLTEVPFGTEDEWYSRVRAYFLITGQVGKAKAVWRNELDFVNGSQQGTRQGIDVATHAGNTTGFDLDTDVLGIETKWLYLEFPFTGPGSLLPFIEQPTTARGGAQPFGHDDKVGILASGDYGGFSLRTAITPEVKNHFSFAQIEEGNSGFNGGFAGNRDSWAIVDTVEFTPQKGLTVRPTVSYAEYSDGNAGSGALGTLARGGVSHLGACGPDTAGFVGDCDSWRFTIGGDVLWREGPYSLEPTFHYQFGERDVPFTAGVTPSEVDIGSWIFDVIGGWREGPLNIQGRFVYTSGNDASDRAASGLVGSSPADVDYYEPINPAFAYFGGWTEIWTGGIEYNNALLGGSGGTGRRQSIGYDQYGLITVAVKGSYSVTPALAVVALVSPSWTAEDVDTNGVFTGGAAGILPSINPATLGAGDGDENFLGTEINFGFNWKFAPNLTFSWRYAHLFAGDALDQCNSPDILVLGLPQCTDGAVSEADDVDLTVARVRYTF